MLATFTLAFFLALPLFDLALFRRHLNAQRQRPHKSTYYGQLLLELWLPTGVVVLLALAGAQALQPADLGWHGPRLETEILPVWLSISIAVLAVIFAAYSIIDLLRLKYNAAYRTAVRDKLKSVKMPEYLGLLMPESRTENRLYAGVAISAGIAEEALYRGFLTFVLVNWFPALGIWPAILISAALFGLGHLYQGISGMVRTFVLGLILSLIYLATGTLWLCIIIHILIDLAGTVLETADSRPAFQLA